ncbi:MAG: FeoB-associated Cys-rich membrane protein [Lachnospiraceae bacterium]|jgi:hypothetical protein|nr:FeoB-associated Cys-rich membrane protein [Lachnospiraceae bacterium]
MDYLAPILAVGIIAIIVVMNVRNIKKGKCNCGCSDGKGKKDKNKDKQL